MVVSSLLLFLLLPTINASFFVVDVVVPFTSSNNNKIHDTSLLFCSGYKKKQVATTTRPTTTLWISNSHKNQIVKDSEDDQRLLLSKPALAAYLKAEIYTWLIQQQQTTTSTAASFTSGAAASQSQKIKQHANDISNAVADAFSLAHDENILSHLGSLISFLQTELSNATVTTANDDNNNNNNNGLLLFAANNNNNIMPIRTSPYQVAKRTVDILHHRLYRGTYTKTITPTGAGDDAARKAVGLMPLNEKIIVDDEIETEQENKDEEDTCLVEPPPELVNVECLWRKSDEEAWRQRRFEKITMEGWRDPRRGNSGTSR